MSRQILHVDMDAFYASVEQRDDPSLRGKPVIVGGPSRRGVVCAASYEVRPFGVRSAMPMAEAMRRCPHAAVVVPRMERYAEVSEHVFAIFRRFTPLVEGLSLDEAFLDVTASRSLFGDGAEVARRIREAIAQELSLTASAGVAPSKFVAKIASDEDKPDGLTIVRESEVESFLAVLPIERMWGVGPKAAERLRALGYGTLGDLGRADPRDLERTLGSWGRQVNLLARGIDARDVEPDREAKSVGAEETYEHDLEGREAVEGTLLAHASRVAQRMHEAGLVGRCVTVKVKYHDFSQRTRQLRLPDPIGDATSIFAASRKLLDRFPLAGRRVRLTGVSVSSLSEHEVQPSLFAPDGQDKRHRVESVMAELNERFGHKGLTRAALLDRKGRRET